MTDAKKAPGRNESAWFFKDNEIAELPQETQDVLCIAATACKIGPDYSFGNDGGCWGEIGCKEPIQNTQLLFCPFIATSDSTFELEESLDLDGQGRDKGSHPSTSEIEREAQCNADKSTFM
jgi:hypothetical protein